jgi:hypothetical protein
MYRPNNAPQLISLLPGALSKMNTTNNDLVTASGLGRTACQAMPFHLFRSRDVVDLRRIISNADMVSLTFVSPYEDSGRNLWTQQQMAWPIIMLPEMIACFAALGGLKLNKYGAADKHLYDFLYTVLLHPQCKIQRICFGPCFGWATLADSSAHDSAPELEWKLTQAIALNKSVTEYDLNGPYVNGLCSVVKPWLDGLACRTDLRLFRYSAWFDDCEAYNECHDLLTLRTPTSAVLRILKKNIRTLRIIDLYVFQDDAMDAFYKRMKEDTRNAFLNFLLDNMPNDRNFVPRQDVTEDTVEEAAGL